MEKKSKYKNKTKILLWGDVGFMSHWPSPGGQEGGGREREGAFKAKGRLTEHGTSKTLY